MLGPRGAGLPDSLVSVGDTAPAQSLTGRGDVVLPRLPPSDSWPELSEPAVPSGRPAHLPSPACPVCPPCIPLPVANQHLLWVAFFPAVFPTCEDPILDS